MSYKIHDPKPRRRRRWTGGPDRLDLLWTALSTALVIIGGVVVVLGFCLILILGWPS